MVLRPSIAPSLILLPLAVLAAWLGTWQLDRMQEKRELVYEFENAPELELAEAIEANRPFMRVRVGGKYLSGWHLLLDNKIEQGQAGVHVLTLMQPDLGMPILVNRGWLPMPPDRRSLPEVDSPEGRVIIHGILARPAQDGVRLGEPDRIENIAATRLITYLDMNQLNAAMDGEVSSLWILLAADDPTGFGARAWQPAVILPAQHRAYAVQWFALALTMLIIWLYLARKRALWTQQGERL